MPRVPLDIATGSYESESVPFSAQRCINWIPVIPQPDGKALSPKALFGRPGIKLFSTLAGINRGSIKARNIAYFVNGTSLFSVDSNGASTNRGTIEGNKRVSMATNTTIDAVTKIVIVVPGGKAYVFESPANTLTQITDPDFIVSDTVTFKDGFFNFTASDGLRFFISNLNQPLVFTALDFGSSEFDPDLIVASHVNHNELILLNEETCEFFSNIGGSGFPYIRIPGANIQKGLHAKAGVVQFDNTFVFIGGGKDEDTAIWRVSSSSSAVKISTSAIDNEIQKFSQEEISDCFAMSYARKGNYFVAFTFTSDIIDSKTFIYNVTTSTLAGRSVWCEFQSGVTDNRWDVNSIMFVYGKFLVGDSTTNKIGELDDNTFTDYGDVIFRRKTSQPFISGGLPQFMDTVEITMEAGVGLANGDGSDPEIRMRFSDNGARTFTQEFARKFGKIGEFGRQVRWYRQGQIPVNRVMDFIMTDPVKSNILRLDAIDELGMDHG